MTVTAFSLRFIPTLAKSFGLQMRNLETADYKKVGEELARIVVGRAVERIREITSPAATQLTKKHIIRFHGKLTQGLTSNEIPKFLQKAYARLIKRDLSVPRVLQSYFDVISRQLIAELKHLRKVYQDELDQEFERMRLDGFDKDRPPINYKLARIVSFFDSMGLKEWIPDFYDRYLAEIGKMEDVKLCSTLLHHLKTTFKEIPLRMELLQQIAHYFA